MQNPHEAPAPVSRRQVLKAGLFAGCAVGMSGIPRLMAYTGLEETPQAKSVIHLFLSGGLSHLDTFDPKPDAPVEIRGPYDPVASRLDGVQVGEPLRRVAKVLDRFSLLRAMHHGEAAHERGVKAMLTGYQPSPAIIYPSFGSVVSHELPRPGALPSYVAIPNAREPALGTGYLGAGHGPFSVGGDPAGRGFKVQDLAPPQGLNAERAARRRRLLDLVDRGGALGEAPAAEAMESFYERAFDLVDAPKARAAFDLSKENKKTKDQYGNSRVGQGLLLGRRLVEAGVRFVAIQEGGFDHHSNLERELDRRLPSVDRALAALITDLEQRGLLDSTLVLVTTEFGRTPRINRDRGRDHWPRCFSVALAGGGIKAGYVHGNSGAEGMEPEDGGTTPADLAATVFTLTGIDPSKRLMAPGDRPIDIVRDGKVIDAIMRERGAVHAKG